MMRYIIELEPGVYKAPWVGDPGRTTRRGLALRYASKQGAQAGLGLARRHRPFARAIIHEVRL